MIKHANHSTTEARHEASHKLKLKHPRSTDHSLDSTYLRLLSSLYLARKAWGSGEVSASRQTAPAADSLPLTTRSTESLSWSVYLSAESDLMLQRTESYDTDVRFKVNCLSQFPFRI